MTALVFTAFAIVFAAKQLCIRYGVTVTTGSWLYYLLSAGPLYLVAMPVSAAVLRGIPAAPPLEKSSLHPKQLGSAALICFALMYAGNLAGVAVTSFIGALSGNGMDNLLAEVMNQSDVWAMTTVTVIAAPLFEELFFRKLLIDRLRGYGQRAAVVVSALAFSLIHGNLSQVFYAFGLGLAFGYLYLKTNRVGYTIALHLMINAVGGVASLFAQKAGTAATLVYAALMLSAVVAGTMLFFRYRRTVAFTDELWPDHPPQWKMPALVNTGMISFFVICAALMAWNTIAALK